MEEEMNISTPPQQNKGRKQFTDFALSFHKFYAGL